MDFISRSSTIHRPLIDHITFQDNDNSRVPTFHLITTDLCKHKAYLIDLLAIMNNAALKLPSLMREKVLGPFDGLPDSRYE